MFEIGVSVWRCVETEGFLVCGDGGRHALTCVPVAMQEAHAKFRKGSKKGEFLVHNLAGAKPGDRIRTMAPLDFFEPFTEKDQRPFPIAGLKRTCPFLAHQWSEQAIRRAQRRQRLPSLGTSHSQIDGIMRAGAQIYSLAVTQMRSEGA